MWTMTSVQKKKERDKWDEIKINRNKKNKLRYQKGFVLGCCNATMKCIHKADCPHSYSSSYSTLHPNLHLYHPSHPIDFWVCNLCSKRINLEKEQTPT